MASRSSSQAGLDEGPRKLILDETTGKVVSSSGDPDDDRDPLTANEIDIRSAPPLGARAIGQSEYGATSAGQAGVASCILVNSTMVCLLVTVLA
jgi:hypothetical protein